MTTQDQSSNHWLLWIAMPFASVAGAIAGGAALGLFWYFSSDADPESLFARYILPLIAGGTFGYLLPTIAFKVAPSGKFIAAVAMAATVLTLEVFGLASSWLVPGQKLPTQNTLYAIASVPFAVGALRGLLDKERWATKWRETPVADVSEPSAQVAIPDGEKPKVSPDSHEESPPTKTDSDEDSYAAEYSHEVKDFLIEHYDYEVGAWQELAFSECCRNAYAEGMTTGDAAALFSEKACTMLATPDSGELDAEPLEGEDARFAERMSFGMLATMNRGLASPSNFPRANKLFLLSKGALVTSFDEIEEMLEDFSRSVLDMRRRGIHYDANATMGMLLAMAEHRGIIPPQAK